MHATSLVAVLAMLTTSEVQVVDAMLDGSFNGKTAPKTYTGTEAVSKSNCSPAHHACFALPCTILGKMTFYPQCPARQAQRDSVLAELADLQGCPDLSHPLRAGIVGNGSHWFLIQALQGAQPPHLSVFGHLWSCLHVRLSSLHALHG